MPSVSLAQSVPAPILQTPISLTESFTPALIRGITIHPDNPLKFDFIVDVGDDHLQGDVFQKESMKLIKYFLVSLTVPENDMWVNLNPAEKDRIIPDSFGQTEMGRDMLLQDYVLKRLTASLMNPDEKLGKEFWEKIYKESQEKLGTTDIPTDVLNKVWIVPDKAEVFVKGQSVFVAASHLKVMLEGEYKNSDKWSVVSGKEKQKMNQPLNTYHLPLTTQLMKEIIIPAIEKEVNEGKNFAALRQIQNSAILAAWYKKNLKETLLGKTYVDQKKTDGISENDKDAPLKIYNQYLDSFKKGVYDFIKEDYNPETQEVVTRKYVSGGIKNVNHVTLADQASLAQTEELFKTRRAGTLSVELKDAAMASTSNLPLRDAKILQDNPILHPGTLHGFQDSEDPLKINFLGSKNYPNIQSILEKVTESNQANFLRGVSLGVAALIHAEDEEDGFSDLDIDEKAAEVKKILDGLNLTSEEQAVVLAISYEYVSIFVMPKIKVSAVIRIRNHDEIKSALGGIEQYLRSRLKPFRETLDDPKIMDMDQFIQWLRNAVKTDIMDKETLKKIMMQLSKTMLAATSYKFEHGRPVDFDHFIVRVLSMMSRLAFSTESHHPESLKFNGNLSVNIFKGVAVFNAPGWRSPRRGRVYNYATPISHNAPVKITVSNLADDGVVNLIHAYLQAVSDGAMSAQTIDQRMQSGELHKTWLLNGGGELIIRDKRWLVIFMQSLFEPIDQIIARLSYSRIHMGGKTPSFEAKNLLPLVLQFKKELLGEDTCLTVPDETGMNAIVAVFRDVWQHNRNPQKISLGRQFIYAGIHDWKVPQNLWKNALKMMSISQPEDVYFFLLYTMAIHIEQGGSHEKAFGEQFVEEQYEFIDNKIRDEVLMRAAGLLFQKDAREKLSVEQYVRLHKGNNIINGLDRMEWVFAKNLYPGLFPDRKVARETVYNKERHNSFSRKALIERLINRYGFGGELAEFFLRLLTADWPTKFLPHPWFFPDVSEEQIFDFFAAAYLPGKGERINEVRERFYVETLLEDYERVGGSEQDLLKALEGMEQSSSRTSRLQASRIRNFIKIKAMKMNLEQWKPDGSSMEPSDEPGRSSLDDVLAVLAGSKIAAISPVEKEAPQRELQAFILSEAITQTQWDKRIKVAPFERNGGVHSYVVGDPHNVDQILSLLSKTGKSKPNMAFYNRLGVYLGYPRNPPAQAMVNLERKLKLGNSDGAMGAFTGEEAGRYNGNLANDLAKGYGIDEPTLKNYLLKENSPQKVSQFIQLMNENKPHILEIGSSIGKSSITIAESNPSVNVTAIEADRRFANTAEILLGYRKMPNLNMLLAHSDYFLPGLNDYSLDSIVFVNPEPSAFDRIIRDPEQVRQLLRTLKKDGEIVVATSEYPVIDILENNLGLRFEIRKPSKFIGDIRKETINEYGDIYVARVPDFAMTSIQPTDKVSLIVGKFAPFHKGHEMLIKEALKQSDKVILLVYDHPELMDISAEEMADLIRQIIKDDRLIVKPVYNAPPAGDTAKDRQDNVDFIKAQLPQGIKIEKVFNNEWYGKDIADALGSEVVRVDPTRSVVPVSAEDIRRDPEANKQYLDPLIYERLKSAQMFPESKEKRLFKESISVDFVSHSLTEDQKQAIRQKVISLNPGYDQIKLLNRLVWNLDYYRRKNLPATVAVLEDKEAFSRNTGMRVLDMPIYMPGQGWAIPKALEQFREVIQKAVDNERSINPDIENDYIYITIDQKPIEPNKTQRRYGFHGDAFITSANTDMEDEIITDNTYVISDGLSSEFSAGPFDLNGIEPEDDEAVLKRFQETAERIGSVVYPPYTLLKLTPYDIHTPSINKTDQTMNRTFVKIAFSRERYNMLGNTMNPLLNYDNWTWVPRDPTKRNHRNIIVDWNREDKDEFIPIDTNDIDFTKVRIDVPWAKPEVFWAKKREGVSAQKAQKGEIIETRVNGFVVTFNIAQQDDWKITTSQGDQYFLSDAKFKSRYLPEPNESGLYMPMGKPQRMLTLTKPIRKRSSWGAMQYVPAGSVLVYVEDEKEGGHTYAIHKDNFEASYVRTDKEGNILLGEMLDPDFLEQPQTSDEQLKQKLIDQNPRMDEKDIISIPDSDMSQFNKPQLPAVIGSVKNPDLFSHYDPEKKIRVLDLLIYAPGQGWAIPKELEQFKEEIKQAVEAERLANPDMQNRFVHITIDQKIVEPQQYGRRPGLHMDMSLTDENGKQVDVTAENKKYMLKKKGKSDTTYFVYDKLPTGFYPGPFPQMASDETNVPSLEEMAKDQTPVTFPPYTMLRLTGFNVHAAEENTTGQPVQRTFLKIQFTEKLLERDVNTINPNLNYKLARQVSRERAEGAETVESPKAITSTTKISEGLDFISLINSKLSSAEMDEKGISVVTHIPDQNVFIENRDTQTHRLGTALSELMLNAKKYTQANGTVTVEIRRENDDVVFSIKNTGPGISQEDLPKIWTEDFRTETAKAMAPGTGRGLEYVKEVIENIYKGHIDVHSEINVETVFNVRFPINDKAKFADEDQETINLIVGMFQDLRRRGGEVTILEIPGIVGELATLMEEASKEKVYQTESFNRAKQLVEDAFMNERYNRVTKTSSLDAIEKILKDPKVEFDAAMGVGEENNAAVLEKEFAAYEGEIYYPAGELDIDSIKGLANKFPKVSRFVYVDNFAPREKAVFAIEPGPIELVAEQIQARLKQRLYVDLDYVNVEVVSSNEMNIQLKFNSITDQQVRRKTFIIRYVVADLYQFNEQFPVVYVQGPGLGGRLSQFQKFWDKIYQQTKDGGYILVSNVMTEKPPQANQFGSSVFFPVGGSFSPDYVDVYHKTDKAMAIQQSPGGIDLNANERVIKETGEKMNLPVVNNSSEWQNFQTNGFVPVIINIIPPQNLYLLLSAAGSDASSMEISALN